MIYIIDHEDSFTWNVVHQFSAFDEVYCSNYFEIDTKKLNKANTIVFSPGPGSPSDYPLTSKIYKRYKGKKKIIGICLGFQQILYCENAKIMSFGNLPVAKAFLDGIPAEFLQESVLDHEDKDFQLIICGILRKQN